MFGYSSVQASAAASANAEAGPKTDDDVVKLLLSQIKVHGHFDEFRKQCSEVIESERQFEELAEDVRWFVRDKLSKTVFTPTLTKAKVRGDLRNLLLQDRNIGQVLKKLTHRLVAEHCQLSLLPIVENLLFEYLRDDQKERVLEWEKRKFELAEMRANSQRNGAAASADIKSSIQGLNNADSQADFLSPNAVSPNGMQSRSSMVSPNSGQNAVSPTGGANQLNSPSAAHARASQSNMMSPGMVSPTSGALKDGGDSGSSSAAKQIKERLRQIESELKQQSIGKHRDSDGNEKQTGKPDRRSRPSRFANAREDEGDMQLDQRSVTTARRPAIQIHLHTQKSAEHVQQTAAVSNDHVSQPDPPAATQNEDLMDVETAADEKQQLGSSRGRLSLAETFRREVERRARHDPSRASPRRSDMDANRSRFSQSDRDRYGLQSRYRQDVDSRRRAEETMSHSQNDVRRFYVPRRVVDERSTHSRADSRYDRRHQSSHRRYEDSSRGRTDSSRQQLSHSQSRHQSTHSQSHHRHSRSRSRGRDSRSSRNHSSRARRSESRSKSKSRSRSTRMSQDRSTNDHEAATRKRLHTEAENEHDQRNRDDAYSKSAKRMQMEAEIRLLREQVEANKRLIRSGDARPSSPKRVRREGSVGSHEEARATDKRLGERSHSADKRSASVDKRRNDAGAQQSGHRDSSESSSESSDGEEGSESGSDSSDSGSGSSSESESSDSDGENEREDGETSSAEASSSGSELSSSASSRSGFDSDNEDRNVNEAMATKPKFDRDYNRGATGSTNWLPTHNNISTDRYRPRLTYSRPDTQAGDKPRFMMRFNERYASRGFGAGVGSGSQRSGVSRSFGHSRGHSHASRNRFGNVN